MAIHSRTGSVHDETLSRDGRVNVDTFEATGDAPFAALHPTQPLQPVEPASMKGTFLDVGSKPLSQRRANSYSGPHNIKIKLLRSVQSNPQTNIRERAPQTSQHDSSQQPLQPVGEEAPITPSQGSPNPSLLPSPLEATPSNRRLPGSKSDLDVLVGTPIKEGHVNYLLMYDMLTGIRIAVSRTNAKPSVALTDVDFTTSHKLAFDVNGQEMSPTSWYDFKFKDYAPQVFKEIRQAFRVDPAEYLKSLTGKYVLSELGSPGKSGSFFYFSHDYRFIIKTVHHAEHKFLRKILKQYYELPGNRKVHFVVMGNVFPPNKDMHEIYDLKGSTVGRFYSEEKAMNNPLAVLKDLNWVGRKQELCLGPEKRGLFVKQMEKDVEFLVKMKIMDYSLLVGIHDAKRGNADKVRDHTLSVLEPKPEALAKSSEKKKVSRTSSRKTIEIDAFSTASSKFPEEIPQERRHVVFYQEEGGFQATDDNNAPLPKIYYIGIIDIFTKYNLGKKAEHFFRSLTNDEKMISAVKPKWYGKRFLSFMKAAIRRSRVTAPNEDSVSMTDAAVPGPEAPSVDRKGVVEVGLS
ncbi:Phosphatidylinositol-4-phosphate 5-kinase [Quaeritorhiza haematococci]|nr:Phosphatidylinositol-4-phosphate 5-kinase [Quaeritorhiza haematococci]